jgi:hypothetical protein
VDAVTDGHTVGVAGVLDLDHLSLSRQIRAVEPLRDHAIQTRTLERVNPLRALLGILGGASDMAPLFLVDRVDQCVPANPKRFFQQGRVAGG